jgi:hypothetical protein
MGKSNIIEINGRRYDAHTGQPLDSPAATEATSEVVPRPDVEPVTEQVRPAARVTRSAAAYHNRLSTKATSSRAARVAQPVSDHAAAIVKSTPKVRVHDAVKARPQKRRPQHSTTLMRAAVAKPGKNLRRHAKAQSPADTLADQPAARLQRKASVYQVDDKRLQRAHATAKSQAVSRFSRPHGPAPQPPTHKPARQPKPAEFPASHLSSPLPPPIPVRAHHKALNELNDLVEHALQQAASHLEPAPAAPKRRLFWRFSD